MYSLLIIAEEEPIEIQRFYCLRHFESKRNEWIQIRLDDLSLAF